VKIFDPQGRIIKTIAENELLGTQGFMRWDGDDDKGQKARIGYYMVLFEIFDEQGNLDVYRKGVVIAARF
jgi:flagellar hook assembly protein FlgD